MMTNAEAIVILTQELHLKCPHDREAYELAIQALKQPEYPDVISRNAVIRMLNTMDRYTAEKLKLCDTEDEYPRNEVFIVDDVYEGLDLLPAVQPEIISFADKGPCWVENTKGERIAFERMSCDKVCKILDVLGD